MTQATANIAAFLSRRRLDPRSSRIQGVQAFLSHEARISASVEEGFESLSVTGPDGVGHAIPREDPAFAEACAAMRRGFRLAGPLRESDVPDLATFSFGCAALIEVGDAARALNRAMALRDESAAEEASWVLFKHSRSFRASACTREEFVAIRREALVSDYIGSMGFSDYYDWWRDSLSHVGPDGELTDASREAAGRLLDAWIPTDKDLDSLVYWTCRNIQPEVHPRHQPLFRALVEERLAEHSPPSP